MTSCELNQIFLGEIASVQNYGAFVRIPGCKQQGLIHKSQVSSSRVDDVADVLQRGERVWCKVININDDGKVALSMKHVNQGSGKDLDPNGVEQRMDEQRRKKLVRGSDRTIRLEAVLNVTCTKCSTRGHLAVDCFSTPDGKRYDLVPEFEETDNVESVKKKGGESEETSRVSEKSKSNKKSEKSKRRLDTGTDDDDDATEERRAKKKKKTQSEKPKRKTEKKKKRRHRENSNDGDSRNDAGESRSRRSEGYADSDETKSKKCKHSRYKHSD